MDGNQEVISEDYVASGTKAQQSHGILYSGDYQHLFDGTSIAIRSNARALEKVGFPVLLRPVSSQVMNKQGVLEPLHNGLDPLVHREVSHLTRTSVSATFPIIRHFVPTTAENMIQRIMRGAVGPMDSIEVQMQARKIVYGATILYTVWERDSIPKNIAREMSRVRENWVPSTQNAEMLKRAGVSNVVVVPHPFDPEDSICLLTQRPTISSRKFYAIGRWEPRKNFHNLIGGFMKAFSPSDDVSLVIKCHGQWKDYKTPDESVEFWQNQFSWWAEESAAAKIQIMSGFFNRSQIIKLHYMNNIYVSPSCGEAWGLPAFEAKVAGNKLVHVPWGGTQDFAGPDDIEIGHTMESPPKSYGWEDTKWASASVDQIATALKKAEPGRFARSPEFDNRFSLASVGALMKERILEIPNAREVYRQ